MGLARSFRLLFHSVFASLDRDSHRFHASRCSLLVGVARIVRRHVVALARIVRGSVSFSRAAISPAYRCSSRSCCSARVPAGARCWLELLASFGAAWSQLLVSFGARCRSVGPREVRRIAGARCTSPRKAAPPSLLFKTRTLSQRENDNPADVHAGQGK